MAKSNQGGRTAKKAKPSMAARKRKFLDILRRTNNISRSAREALIGVTTVYRHRAKNENFAADWDAAVAEALDALESAAMERAAQGIEKKVYYAGKECGSVRHYSDALTMFMLRSRRPEIYGRPQAQMPGEAAPGREEMTDAEARAEIERRLDLLAQRRRDGEDDGGAG